MLHTRSSVLCWLAGAIVVCVGIGFAGCKRDQKAGDQNAQTTATNPAATASMPPQSEEELNAPLAKVDDKVITVGEFQERINRQSPYIRARYTSLEQKREFLNSLIRFEVLASEAQRRGFDKDPEVVRTMKQVMIQKLMKSESEKQVTPDDITEDEMRAFYKENQGDYVRSEEVRASAIVLKDKATADKVAKEATAEAASSNKAFRDLVNKHSTDETTKLRGGDLRYFNRESKDVPKPVVDAAFALAKTGDIAGPIAADNGTLYIVKLTGRRKAVDKKFDEVKRQIQNRLYRQKRSKSQKEFIDGIKNKSSIEIVDENLNRVRIAPAKEGTIKLMEDGPGHGATAFDVPAAQ